ncbi:unnamed protein product [Cylicocyclus nassatus]|uniref:Snake toxin/toxin-like domain-containing protein n=1 Tax=Cylicocyclus nassatus TaxID=53992 RepID=A0AA36GVW6_CYLNA|nr:unnamed protein product [Cylicocyclus nassatus]
MSVTILFVTVLFFTHFIYVSSLLCYVCSFTYGEDSGSDRDARCANKSLLMLNLDDAVRKCASWEKSCMTSLSVMHHSIASVKRGCGDGCSKKCKHTGYGTNQVECDDCCKEDLCNANFSLSYYEEVMKRQSGSWVTPLSGEQKWNRKNKFKFPY